MRNVFGIVVIGGFLLWGCAGEEGGTKQGTQPQQQQQSQTQTQTTTDTSKAQVNAGSTGAVAQKKWTCPHCGGEFDKPGKCPGCNMDLVEKT